MGSTGKYFISKTFFKNLALAIALIIVLFLITLIWLRIFTHHGRSFPTPDYTGLSLEEVEKVSSKKKLRFQIIDSVYNNNFERGAVVEQNPSAGFHVKKNRNIFLTINAFNPEMTELPNVKGLSLRQAKATLERSGCKVGRIKYEPDIATNNVLQQKIDGNTIEPLSKIEKGSKIDLVLGLYDSANKSIIPDLRGKSIENASDVLILSSLNLGRIRYDESFTNKTDSLKAKVYNHYPVFDGERAIRYGRNVDIWVTINPEKLIFEEDSTKKE